MNLLIFLSMLFFAPANFGEVDSIPSVEDSVSAKIIYSNLLGYEIDTIENEILYKTISDWLFTKYQYGGRAKTGIDCSDFSSILYHHAYNITMSGGSADVCKQSVMVQKSELKEGDLVFFKINKNRVSHMGVYLSKNKFAHATVKAGVIISDLDETYYKKYFYIGGRLVKSTETQKP